MAISAILNIFDRVIDQVIPDKDQAAKLKAEARTEEHEDAMKRIDGIFAEAVELAKHPNIFVSGARPAGIWLLNGAIAVTLLTALWMEVQGGGATEFIKDILKHLLQGLGFLFGVRSFDKLKGTARR